MSKRNVYLCQVNHRYGRSVFLPYSVGLLQAYAQTFDGIRDNYDFKELIFLREPVKDVVARMDNPDVFAASLYIWNSRYTLALAREVSRAYPKCLVVLGGPHVPNDPPPDWFQKHPSVHALIHGEGEVTFADLLLERNLPHPDYRTVKGLSHRGPWDLVTTNAPRPRLSDLEKLPSPYLSGVFDGIVSDPRFTYQVTSETHRGCPYQCTFCDWGSNLLAKVRKFSDDRILAEYEWAAKHSVEMLYNADANYGMFERDVELTRRMVEVKRRTGYPQKFRAAYAKNSGERVFQISKMLNDAGMSKGTTLSFQSLDEGTLVNIKRKNIDMSNFRELMARYNGEGIPTYSELIVGMPGETYDTFASGIERLLDAGQHSGLNVYTAELLPNSEMSRPDYREKHGIKSVEVPQLFYHATPGEDPHREYYEIVTATSTLPESDWLRCQLFSWAVQTLHCLGLTQYVARFAKDYCHVPYREFYEDLIQWAEDNPSTVLGVVYSWACDFYRGMQKGELSDPVDLRFGNVSWPPEEFAFLKIVTEWKRFYRELRTWLVTDLIPQWDEDTTAIIDGVVCYQRAVLKIPAAVTNLTRTQHREIICPQEWDIRKWFADGLMEKTNTPFRVRHERVYDNLEEYAREIVWYNRKGGNMLETNVTVVE